MTAGKLGGGGNGMATEKPCDSVALMSGFRTETITVLAAVAERPVTVTLMTPGTLSSPANGPKPHTMPGHGERRITNAPGLKLLPVMVNVTCPLCCVTLTFVIEGVGGGGGEGGAGGGDGRDGVRVTADSGEAADPPQPASAAENKNIAARQHHARNRF